MIIKGLIYLSLIGMNLIVLCSIREIYKKIDTLDTCSKLFMKLSGKCIIKKHRVKNQKRDNKGKFIK